MSTPKIISSRYVIDPKASPRMGGMSMVYAALDLENGGRRVALKVFKGDALTFEDPIHGRGRAVPRAPVPSHVCLSLARTGW